MVMVLVAAGFLLPAGASWGMAAAPIREEAAAELLKLMHVDRAVGQAIDVICTGMVRENPQLRPYEEVLRSFLRKEIGWEQVGQDHVRLYAETFSAEELRQLIAFYKTATGQKILAILPDLQARGAAFGQKRLEQHLDVLQEMIRARAKEMEEKPPSP
jgi:hypothetical protein